MTRLTHPKGMPPVVVDRREQRPWPLPNAVWGTLAAGDYSIQTFETRVAVERKSHIDLLGSVGKGRVRFEKEMKRLSSYRFAAIVIEASMSDIMNCTPVYSRMNPVATLATLADWSCQYGVHVVFACNRRLAAAYARKLLERAWVVLSAEDVKENQGKGAIQC